MVGRRLTDAQAIRALRTGIAICTFTAFACLFRDSPVLMGPLGLDPAARTLEVVRARAEHPWLALPTLFWWLPTTDVGLRALSGVGMAGSVSLLLPRLTPFAAPFLAVLYLSLANAGGSFFTFQWDALIVETLTLCTLLSSHPGRAARLAFWALNMKLYLESGLAKVLWSDDWTSLRAMGNYWQTTPLPTPVAWWFARLPDVAQSALTAATLVGECAAPFLMFTGIRGRSAFGVIAIGLQVGILLTGNYGAFNYLSIALAFALFWEGTADTPARGMRGVLAHGFVGVWAALSLSVALSRFAGIDAPLSTTAARLRFANAYHLFASIDPERDEVEFIGSDDGESWSRLPLAYKPAEAMAFLAPYHPRVAFSAWFWTLGARNSSLGLRVESPSWGSRLVQRWCESPEVLTPILTHAVHSPRFVTLEFWRGSFADDRVGWRMEPLGRYPAVHECRDGGAPHFSQVTELLQVAPAMQ